MTLRDWIASRPPIGARYTSACNKCRWGFMAVRASMSDRDALARHALCASCGGTGSLDPPFRYEEKLADKTVQYLFHPVEAVVEAAGVSLRGRIDVGPRLAPAPVALREALLEELEDAQS